MAGGQRIDDHSFWAGKGSKESVFPLQAKMKSEPDDGHDGHLSNYEDTTEAIHRQQEMNMKKAKSLPRKDGFRN